MNADFSNSANDNDSSNGLRICIVIPRSLEYTLLANLLEKKLGIKCENAEFPENLVNLFENNGDSTKLVLWDCYGKTKETILDELSASTQNIFYRCPICLFNVLSDMGIEPEAFELGVRGFIYKDDNLDYFVKGVRIMSTGKLWISRRILTHCFDSNLAKRNRMRYIESIFQYKRLKQRQIEILSLIAEGKSNNLIADELYISCHTVKTHITNIYRKIDVSSRVHAALWALKHL